MLAARLFVAVVAALILPVDSFAQTARPPSTGAAPRLKVSPKLATELAPMLDGLSADSAARGFRSLPDFITVLHVARNLEIPFPTLKKRVVTERIPLDIAVRRMRPGIDVKKEIARAEQAAEVMLKNGG